MTQLCCPEIKTPNAIVFDTHDRIDPLAYTYHPCPGIANPDRSWLCEECGAAKAASTPQGVKETLAA